MATVCCKRLTGKKAPQLSTEWRGFTLVCYEKFERIETSQFQVIVLLKNDFYRESIEIIYFSMFSAEVVVSILLCCMLSITAESPMATEAPL